LIPTLAPAQSLRVILLGTGNPEPLLERFSAGILVEAGARKLLFDGGRGGTIRLAQMKIRAADVNPLFLTHLHSDHVVGIPDLLLTGWLRGRETPLQVFGPEGTAEMMRHLEQAYQADIQFRISSGARTSKGVAVLARNIAEGAVYEEGGVKVTAFEVSHARTKPAFGYRVDYAGRSVVLSGDTGPTENLIRFAQGVDLLIHEVSLPGTGPGAGGASHTTPEDAGNIFSRVKPRLAVYSHIIPPNAPAEEFMVGTRKTYTGPLEMGEDLMSIEVGDEIRVSRFGK
jgi:ribonuclease Z